MPLTRERIEWLAEVSKSGRKTIGMTFFREVLSGLLELSAERGDPPRPATRQEREADGGIAFLDSDGQQALLCIRRFDSLLGIAYFKAREADLRCAGYVPDRHVAAQEKERET